MYNSLQQGENERVVYRVRAFVSGVQSTKIKTMLFELCLDDSTCAKIVRPSKALLCSMVQLAPNASHKLLKKKWKEDKKNLSTKWSEIGGLIDLIVNDEHMLEIVKYESMNHHNAKELFELDLEYMSDASGSGSRKRTSTSDSIDTIAKKKSRQEEDEDEDEDEELYLMSQGQKEADAALMILVHSDLEPDSDEEADLLFGGD